MSNSIAIVDENTPEQLVDNTITHAITGYLVFTTSIARVINKYEKVAEVDKRLLLEVLTEMLDFAKLHEHLVEVNWMLHETDESTGDVTEAIISLKSNDRASKLDELYQRNL